PRGPAGGRRGGELAAAQEPIGREVSLRDPQPEIGQETDRGRIVVERVPVNRRLVPVVARAQLDYVAGREQKSLIVRGVGQRIWQQDEPTSSVEDEPRLGQRDHEVRVKPAYALQRAAER